MHKITFNYLSNHLFYFILFFNFYFSFAQDKSIEITQQFSLETEAKSEITKIDYKNTSPFVMLSGYTTNINFNNTVYYRIQVNKAWSEWVAFKKPHSGEDIDRFVLGEVFIEKAFENIQFKTERPTDSKFTFRLFFPEYTKNTNLAKTRNKTLKQAAGGCAQPAYQGRSDWCPNGDCPKSSSPSTINPTHIVVHHSAGQTNSADYAAVVRGYWDYHVNSRGWADIGYNWLVDPNGVLYEGRGDRIRGAHSPCMNAIATGICYIGDYEANEPATAGINAIKDFIAWDATDKNIDVTSSSFVTALNGNIENISGHKDGFDQYPAQGCTSTLCPGAHLHNKLQSIRTDVSNYSCYVSSANAPDTPLSFSVIRKSTSSVEIKIKPVATATKYGIYKSIDNSSFQKVLESASTTNTVDNLTQGEVYYFKIEAINNDGVSDKSGVLAAMPSEFDTEFLIVDGITRSDFDAIIQYDYPMTQLGRTFSSATSDAVEDGTIDINNYTFVIWMLLEESSNQDTFNKNEQTKVKSFIDNGGVFIVSGSEIGWDLVEKGDSTDKSFYGNYLKAEYIADAPDNLKETYYTTKGTDNKKYNFDNGSHGIINIDWPDEIKATNGSSTSFTYNNFNGTGVAGISYQSSNGGVEYLAFPIEAVYNDTERKDLLNYLFSKYSNLLAVDNSFISKNIELYPNPTSGLIQISNPNSVHIYSVDVYNIYGQKLQSNYQNNSVDISNLSNGIYMIRIEDDNGKQGTFKVIKN